MRALFALMVARHIPASLAHFEITVPNGMARLLDLRFLLDPHVFAMCRYALWAALVLYVLRIGWSIALPYMTLLSVAVGSVINSRGAIEHYLQIVSLVLLVQTIAHYSRVIPQWRGRSIDRGASETRAIEWTMQAIAAVYLASGVTKLIASSGAWVIQSPLIALQIAKSNEQDFYDTLDPARAASGLVPAEWLAAHPLLVGLVMTAGLLVELTAPLILLGRRWALVYGVALIAFHQTIGRVMKLHFVYNEYLLWIYLVNVPFWAWLAARRLRRSTPEEVSHPRATKVHNGTN